MIVRSVRLHNIRSYLDQTVEFPDGSVMLSGDIGSGKSTILLAIEFALFGVMRGVLDGSALLRHGKEAGFVELRFIVDGKDVFIRREVKRSRGSVSQDTGYLIMNGDKVAATPTELKARVLELLGYPQQLLTKSKELIYRFTVYTPQEEMKRILFDDSESRLDTLRRIFQVDKYRRIRDNTLIFLQELRAMQRELSARVEGLEEKQRQKGEFEKKLESANAAIFSFEPKLKEHEELVAAKKREIDAVEESMRELNNLKRQFEVLKTKSEEKLYLKSSIRTDLQSAEKKTTELGERLKVSACVMNEQELTSELELVEKNLEEVNKAISQHEFVKTDSEKKKLRIDKLDECPTCFQSVSQEHKQKIYKAEDEKISVANATVSDKLDEKRLLNEKLVKLRSSQKLLIDARYLTSQLNELLERKKQLQQKEQLLEKEITGITEGRMLVEEKLRAFPDIEETYSKKKKELGQLQALEKELLVKKAHLEKERENINLIITTLDSEIRQKLEAKDKLNKVKHHHYWLEEFFMNLTADIEKHVMVSTNETFNGFFRQWFNMLMEDETIAARIDDSFSPVIEQNGYEADISNLSGGEKTSCALAYRLALNKVINDMITNIKTRNLIILDEPTDGFSTEQLEKVRDVINELNAKQLIIVSHEPKVESFVNNVIRIVKQSHISRVV